MTRKQCLAAFYGVGLAALVSMPAFAQTAAPQAAPQSQPAAKPATAPQSQPAGQPEAKPATAPQAKPAAKARMMMKYDAKTEVTVSGTIEDIKAPSKGGAESVTLKTETGNVDVHLAPTDFWTKNGFTLTKGASIDVTGSKAQMGKSVIILARTVTAGEKTVTLRNAEGAPAWMHQHHTK
jgi:DNA/RNA endonuclease YhcR with UshA esterase domain